MVHIKLLLCWVSLGISYQSNHKIIPCSWPHCCGVRGLCHGAHGGRPGLCVDEIARTTSCHEIVPCPAHGVYHLPGPGHAQPPCALDAPLDERDRAGPRVARPVARPHGAFCQSVLSGAISLPARLRSHDRPVARLHVPAPSSSASPASAHLAGAARARATAPQPPASSLSRCPAPFWHLTSSPPAGRWRPASPSPSPSAWDRPCPRRPW